MERVEPESRRRCPTRLDRGATFIELLVSVVLLGIAGVAVLAAATTAVTGARTSDQISKAQSTLAEAADYLSDLEPENVTYTSCETPNNPVANYQTALDTQFGTGRIQVVAVRYWDRTAGAAGAFGTTCRFEPEGDRLQQVRLRSVTNGSTREIDVIKRPVAVPTLDTIAAPPAPPYAGGSGQVVVSPTPGLP